MMLTKKIFTCVTLILVFSLTIFSSAAAKSNAELKNILIQSLDDTTLRIEINFKGKLSEDDLSARVSGKYFTVDLDKTIPGRISKISGVTNNAKDYVEKLYVGEVKLNQTRVQLTFSLPIGEDDYKISVLPANRSEKKSDRIIIDVKKPQPKNNSLYTPDVKGKVIVLDAGHGGSDSGARGHRGVLEKNVTLAVALKTEKLLTDAGAKVIMTRTTDRDVASAWASNGRELQARVDKAPPETDIFISIHCNAFSNSWTRGMETYYYAGSPQSRRLAKILNEELAKFGGLYNRGVKTANFYVLRHSSHPASLVELAFITNYAEENLLADETFQDSMAKAITSAAQRFFSE